MPLTVDNSRELLNGAIDMATQKTQRVKVTRAFYEKGQIRGPGSVLDLSASTAAELRHAKKVEFVQSDTKLARNSEVPLPADASVPKDFGKGAQKVA